MKFLNKNSMSKVLINKLVENNEKDMKIQELRHLLSLTNPNEDEYYEILDQLEALGDYTYSQGENFADREFKDNQENDDLEESNKTVKEGYYVKVFNSDGTDIDTYETENEQDAISYAESQKKDGNRAVVYDADSKEALYDYDPNNLKEDAWDDNFVISVIQNDGVYWKRKSDGKEIKTSFEVFTNPTDPTEWKSEEELSQYALEEDLGPAQKVYNKRVLNNKKKVNTAKNSATNLNEDSYESGIFYEIEEALREAGLNPARFNENGIMTNNIGWTVTGEDGTEQQITCDGSYLDDEEINQ